MNIINEIELNAKMKASEARAAFENGCYYIAKGCQYPLDDRKTKVGNNVLAVGGSGTGKTQHLVKPNIKAALGSYVIVDPKGNLSREFGEELRKNGYRIVALDFGQPDKGARYNPMKNLRSSQDILKLAGILVDEKASRESSVDPFWDSMTIIFISALIGYMIETGYEPMNFSSILELMREGERAEDSKRSLLAARFAALKTANPSSWACAMFENVNQSPERTYDSIRATVAAKFAKFDTMELRKMMSGSDVDFKRIGMEKTAVFVTVSDTDRTMDPLVNMFFTQAMQGLCDYADRECADNRLPVPVRFILDDFATNCRIEEFPRMISSIRSRGISVMLMIQSEAQLAQGYGCDDKTIISNCDTYIYLGGNDIHTAEEISLRCNKPLERVLTMPVGSCWVFRRGEQPVFTELNSPRDYSREL